MPAPEQYLEAFVELTVGFGANVQPGQVVGIDAETGLEPYARAVADAAYKRGAKFVDVWYFDPHVKHSRLKYADRETLSYVPPWIGQRLLDLGELHGARIWLYGDTEPHLMEDVDPSLLGLDILPRRAEGAVVVSNRSTNWTVVPVVTPGWAHTVYPDLPTEAAYEKLWETIADVCRLTEPDPVAAWEARFARLRAVIGKLSALELDSLHFEGPGTDLTIGLLPDSRWVCADFETAWGLRHCPNLPSEEVFTTPDPDRTRGVVTATKPLLVPGATPITGLKVHFQGGRAVHFEAESGAEALASMAARDEGACRLGEVALVDQESRVGQVGDMFYNTLLDENAASHIALGNGFAFAVNGDAATQINRSSIHVDFMIGSEAVSVTGVTHGGDRVPLLRGGVWEI
ncbi:MAG TPA: aminopeptidase [Solirubrobacteraceae bacterium]|nr:aminopeptidase [Solirubrobacteraceae bacterium]